MTKFTCLVMLQAKKHKQREKRIKPQALHPEQLPEPPPGSVDIPAARPKPAKVHIAKHSHPGALVVCPAWPPVLGRGGNSKNGTWSHALCVWSQPQGCLIITSSWMMKAP